jgi:hypothetical protein
MDEKKEKPMQTGHRSWWANRWFLPGFAVALGLGLWGASWAGGHPGQGALSFAAMAAFGAVFALGGRSETVRGMRGDGRDERWAMIDLRATAVAGLAVIIAVIAGFFIQIAHGRSGWPYAQLGAVAGTAYLLAFFVGRWRS